MRTNQWIVSVTLASLSTVSCGPRVSLGDLGGGGGGGDGSAGAATAGTAGVQPTEPGSGGSSSAQAGSASDGQAGATSSGGSQSAAGATGPTSSAGAAGTGGSALPPGCPADLRQTVPQPQPDCPASPPGSNGSACTWTENGICVWQDGPTSAGFSAVGCYASLTGTSTYGLSQGNLGPIGVDNDQCPRVAPSPSSSCVGHTGQDCYYPLEGCSCATGGDWSCTPNFKPASPPLEVKRLCPPAGVDETEEIKDLSDDEALAWCNWYADPSGAPRPAVAPGDSPDEARSYGSIWSSVGVKACVADLPAELCVKNLRTQPCTATLGELDDCIESMRAMGFTPPGWVGRGCAPLMANPSCPRVIAQPVLDATVGGECGVPLH